MNTPVSFEIAKLLKEKGFNYPTRQRYFIAENIDSDKFPFLQEDCALHSWNDYDDSSTSYYSAPTIAEVVMWLYEKHGIWIFVKLGYGHEYVIQSTKVPFSFIHSEGIFKSPTEAYEAAIEYTLKNLI